MACTRRATTPSRVRPVGVADDACTQALGRVTAASRSAKPGRSSLLPIREAIELHRLVVVMLDQGKAAPPVVVAPHSPQRFADRGHATEDMVA